MDVIVGACLRNLHDTQAMINDCTFYLVIDGTMLHMASRMYDGYVAYLVELRGSPHEV